MKKTFTLIPFLALVLCGCRNFEATLPGGAKVKSSSFVCKLSVGSVTVGTNGTVTVSNYNLDQVAGAQAIAQGVAQGVIEGAKLAK